MIKLYSTLTRQKEEFAPLKEGTVLLYTCGPTVYDYPHIGNLYSALIWDFWKRTFIRAGYTVTHVTNFTDFGHLVSDADEGEDKMMKGLRRDGLEITMENMKRMAQKYAQAFIDSYPTLSILIPNKMPFASDYIARYIDLIYLLEQKGFVYRLSDGVYFDTSKDPSYGRLRGTCTHDHVPSEYTSKKHHPSDFALWKHNTTHGWDSPWGHGFPGWHIECSGMSWELLGESFDIHGGGIEHIPIHHTNEIAQSENAFGKPMARYWLHHNLIISTDGEKMSKSLGNLYRLDELVRLGFEPLAFRYHVLQHHYRSEMKFSLDSLRASQTAYDRLREEITRLDSVYHDSEQGVVHEKYDARFTQELSDDLNTPRAVALVYELLRDPLVSNKDKKATILAWDATFFGLSLDISPYLNHTTLEVDIVDLLSKRATARENKDWNTSDELRTLLHDRGYIVIDGKEGQLVKKLLINT